LNDDYSKYYEGKLFSFILNRKEAGKQHFLNFIFVDFTAPAGLNMDASMKVQVNHYGTS